MKTISAIIAASILFSTAAYAGERPNPYTTEQINAALRSLGRCCEIGTSRVLSDDHAGRTETKSDITIRLR